jgi:hypothetical protein
VFKSRLQVAVECIAKVMEGFVLILGVDDILKRRVYRRLDRSEHGTPPEQTTISGAKVYKGLYLTVVR